MTSYETGDGHSAVPIGTARIVAGPTLAADVNVLRIYRQGETGWADVITTGDGIGGWAVEGKKLTVRTEIMSGFTTPELAEVRAELTKLRAGTVANFESPTGWGRRGGKQVKRRFDAKIKRAAKLAARSRVLEAQEQALALATGCPSATGEAAPMPTERAPVNPRSLAAKRAAATRARRKAAGLPPLRRTFMLDNAPAGGWTDADRV